MIARICSRPGSVPTPIPTVTAAMNTIVRRVNALTRTTRWRRFIELLEVGTDGECERELLEKPGTRSRCHVRAGSGRSELLRVWIASVDQRVAGRRARQGGDIRVVVQRAGFAPVAVIPDVHLNGPHRRDGPDSHAWSPFDLAAANFAVPHVTAVNEE